MANLEAQLKRTQERQIEELFNESQKFLAESSNPKSSFFIENPLSRQEGLSNIRQPIASEFQTTSGELEDVVSERESLARSGAAAERRSERENSLSNVLRQIKEKVKEKAVSALIDDVKNIKTRFAGQGDLFPRLVEKYSGTLSKDEIRAIYDSLSPYGPAKESSRALGEITKKLFGKEKDGGEDDFESTFDQIK